MSHEDQVCLAMGKEIQRIAGELAAVSGPDVGYARREVTFRGGMAITIFVVKDRAVAEAMEKGVAEKYDIEDTNSVSGNENKA